jgi:hypothetical protein
MISLCAADRTEPLLPVLGSEFGAALPAVADNVLTVLVLPAVCVEGRGAIRAGDPQILEPVVGCVAVDVIKDQRHPLTVPFLALAAKLARARLQTFVV